MLFISYFSLNYILFIYLNVIEAFMILIKLKNYISLLNFGFVYSVDSEEKIYMMNGFIWDTILLTVLPVAARAVIDEDFDSDFTSNPNQQVFSY